MVLGFIKNLPFELQNQIISEYNLRVRELEYLLERKPDKYQWLEDIELVKYLLSLGIFYRRVINPISGSVEFTNRVNRLGVPNVSVGSIKLTPENLKELSTAVQEFERILYRFGLSARFFDFDRIEEFLQNIKELKEKDKYEL
jgi:hypothetical protein